MIIKVCGMREPENIRAVEATGTDWMGFIFFPKSPRFVENVLDYLPQQSKRVGVFVNASIDEIVEKISSKALSLEESLRLYEEGNAIIRSLEQALKDAQEKVEKIVNIEDK